MNGLREKQKVQEYFENKKKLLRICKRVCHSVRFNITILFKVMLVMLLRVYIHTGKAWTPENMPVHGENLTYDLWNTSPILCQLSYAVRSVRVVIFRNRIQFLRYQCNLVIMMFSVLV